jgi:ketosteroid isomerase-like protein
MIYSYFVEKLARQSFANVQNHNYDEVLKALTRNVTHHFAGNHALGGTRHDTEALRRWFNRLGVVLPNIRFDVKNVWVKGPPVADDGHCPVGGDRNASQRRSVR